jgi:hypothetical protein
MREMMHTAGLDDPLIDALVNLAAQLARAVVGMPREQMLASLFDVREELKAELHWLPPDVAQFVSELLVTTVVNRRAELERMH